MEEVSQGHPCGQEGCSETFYYLDAGRWFCRNGHQQEGRQVIVDDDNFGSQGKVLRQKRPPSERSSRVYSGSDAYQLFLEAYQLILWKQCHALIHTHGLPQELEPLVKDLWALRLQTVLSAREDATPYVSDGETTSQTFSSKSRSTHNTAATNALEEEEAAYHRKKVAAAPKLIDSLAICYLGVLLLRVPVSVGQLQRWMVKDEFPLIRAIRLVPQVMRDRLPPTYLRALDTNILPTGDRIHRAIAELVLLYHRSFNMKIPSLNVPLMQFSYIRELCLPIEIYPAMNGLQSLLNYSLTYPHVVNGKKFRRIYLPEVQLMSLLIVAAKLLYPFDSDDTTGFGELKTYASSELDPSAQRMDWRTWMVVQRETEEDDGKGDGGMGPEKALYLQETDVFGLSGEQMDEYMDWYEKMFVYSKGYVNNPIASMFPTSRPNTTSSKGATSAEQNQQHHQQQEQNPPPTNSPPSSHERKLHRILSSLTMSHIASDAVSHRYATPLPRPGSRYRRYKTEEELSGKGQEVARCFYEVAAGVIGVSVRTLVLGVFATESKVIYLGRRRGREGEGGREGGREGDRN